MPNTIRIGYKIGSLPYVVIVFCVINVGAISVKCFMDIRFGDFATQVTNSVSGVILIIKDPSYIQLLFQSPFFTSINMSFLRQILKILILNAFLILAKTEAPIRDQKGKIEVEGTPEAQPLFLSPSANIWETAAKAVAQLVSSSFPTPPPQRETSPDFMSNILKILGLDRSKLGAIALNALIFLVHVIGSTISGKTNLKPGEEDDLPPQGDPLTWTFINSPNQARELVMAAEERGLPEKLIGILRDGATVDETDCVQLLLCRSAPIIWSMQNSLYKPPDPSWPRLTPLQRMFTYFPTMEEISQHSATCNVRFPSCKLKHSHLDLE